MPFCEVKACEKVKLEGKEETGVRIFYRRYGRGRTKVLLITGLAGTHESWGPQINGLTGAVEPIDEKDEVAPAAPSDEGLDGVDEEGDGIEVCALDNRGMGRSSVPNNKSEYTTTIMAKDALAVLDHLGWRKAHIFGHSMGAMISCKLAAIAPERVISLALLNVTGGGFECVPRIDRQMISLAFRFLRAKTPEQRAIVDLETHYTKEYLDEYVGPCTRRNTLYQEYVQAISSTGMQSNFGFEGQINACWMHKMTQKELDAIRSSGFLVSVIHGRYDVIAQLDHAKRLAENMYPAARMIELHGGHLVSHERTDEVNSALMELIKASKAKVKPEDWSNLPETGSGWIVLGIPMSFSKRNNEGANGLVTVYTLLGKIQLTFLYLVAVFVMGFRHMGSVLRMMKPVRVAPSS